MPGLIVINLGGKLPKVARRELKAAIQKCSDQTLPKGQLDVRQLPGRSAIDRQGPIPSRSSRRQALSDYGLNTEMWQDQVAAVVWKEPSSDPTRVMQAKLLDEDISVWSDAPRLVWTGTFWDQV